MIMGLGDPEDFIPVIIIIVAILGLLGGLAFYFPVLGTIPVLSMITSVIHSGFLFLAGLMAFIPLSASWIAMILEGLIIVIMIIVVVKVGY